MADQMVDGRRFRILTIVDNFTRENLCLYAAQNVKGDDVVGVLEQVVAQQGYRLIMTVSLLPGRWIYGLI